MKKNQIWIVALLAIVTLLVYFMVQPKKVYEVLKGDTSKMMQKGGSSIVIKYSSEHVDVDTPSSVTITFSSSKDRGVLSVEVYPRQKILKGIKHQTYQFPITSSNQEFKLNLEPFSLKEGRFYINVIASIKGERPKILSIPVEVGDSSKNRVEVPMSKMGKGEQLYIMKAEEEIK